MTQVRSYVRLRPEALDRATFCFPDSYLNPTDVGDRTMVAHLCQLADESASDDLDDYVEAHVHGPVSFQTDVDAVVLDPSFAGTHVEAAAQRLGCQVEFHPGFRATPDELDPTYRGEHIVNLARSLAPKLTPKIIGAAARSANHPNQTLKHLWHSLAHSGRR